METLSSMLESEIEKRGISGAEAGRMCGLCPHTISRIINNNYVSNGSIAKLCDAFGDQFKKFVKYKKCVICGKEFITQRSQITCSKECSDINTASIKREHNDRRKKATIIISPRRKARSWKMKDIKKPKESITEFMGDKQYGDRQREYLISIQKTQSLKELR